MASDSQTRPPPLSREDHAKLEIGHTELTRGMAWVLVGVFLAVIYTVPVLQICLDRAALKEIRTIEARNPESKELQRLRSDYHGQGADGSNPLPQVTDLVSTSNFARIAGAWDIAVPDFVPYVSFGVDVKTPSRWERLMAANAQALRNIADYEEDQTDQSFLTRRLLRPFAALVTRRLGLGNEKGYPGTGNWCFYRSGVEYVTGPGFLDAAQLQRRAAAGSEWQPAPQPDPRRAILEFKEFLAARDIELVLLPAPVKPMIHPEKLSGRYARQRRPLHNASFAAFKTEMEAAGVRVFDPAALLKRQVTESGMPQFLAHDTHWTPGAMDLVARRLAGYLVDENLIAAGGADRYQRVAGSVTNIGDIVTLLQLDGTGVYEPEVAKVQVVQDANGIPWRSDDCAKLLLLGDSFANIFSAPDLNWGEDAGLAQQLSYHLQQPLTAICQNDAGAQATRKTLFSRLAKLNILHGKKVVVWEFAARELADGDWSLLAWDWARVSEEVPVAVEVPPEPAAIPHWLVSGKIQSITRPPKPRSVPYKDCLVQIHLVDVSSSAEDFKDEALVVNLWGMQDHVWTSAAHLKEGNSLQLKVELWDDVAERRKLKTPTRLELDDYDDLIDDDELRLFWGVSKR